MAKSKRPSAPNKPRFPLWFHKGSGQWAKTVRGRRYYFGTDKDQALARYIAERQQLEAGRERVRVTEGEPSLLDLCNHFAFAKKQAVEVGDLSRRSLRDYLASCERMMKHFGKNAPLSSLTPAELLAYRGELAKTRGPHALGNEVTRARVILKYAFDHALIDRPFQYGEFRRPKKSAFRRARSKSGPRMFEPAELRQLVAAAGPHVKAMILLGLNAGFGNADCGTLPTSSLELDAGWIAYSRPKTGIYRRAKLWPETVEALRRSLELRSTPKNPDHADLAFITKYGDAWHVDDGKRQSALTSEFRKLLDAQGLYKPGRSFYTLRHVFQTVADETADDAAVRLVMGHADGTMSETYRERFPDARLELVAAHVRSWLYPAGEAPPAD